MTVLYGRHYQARYSTLASLIPPGASVVELCCGPGTLYRRALRAKEIRYVGLDISRVFVDAINAAGGDGRVWDVRSPAALPGAEYLLLQASLYHFIESAASSVIERMLVAAEREVIIAEPIRNLTNGRLPLSRALGALADPGTGAQPHRYTEQTLDRLLAPHHARLRTAFLLPGGREKAYVLTASGVA
ncbi:MAG: class I SAM-dependent methyltransferase [Actinomycetota bacterium]|nr:class I SAM-dependent methyltransferase [Actinomycetota bacterium]